MVVAISVAVALIPIGVPSFYSKFLTWVQIICNSGITIGSITAIILNLLPARTRRTRTKKTFVFQVRTEIKDLT